MAEAPRPLARTPGGRTPGGRARSRAASALRSRDGTPRGLGLGIATGYLSLIVLLPIAALIASAFTGGVGASWNVATSPVAISALKLTLLSAALVTVVNAVMGTLLAWVLVRDSFPGQRIVDAVVDLPFALPTIVAGLTLIALYGPNSPFGINLAYTNKAVFVALLFVTLPFVVRSVQPVLRALDPEVEEAAASLGAGSATTFRRIILPNLLPSILSGTALAFARAVGEYGAVVLIASNIPFKSQVMSVFIFGEYQNGSPHAAAAASVLLLMISLVILLAIRGLARVGAASSPLARVRGRRLGSPHGPGDEGDGGQA